MSKLLNYICIIFTCVNIASAAKILCLSGVANKDNHVWNNVLFNALADKGHQLTVVTTDLDEQTKHENIKYIHLERAYEYINAETIEMSTSAILNFHLIINLIKWYKYQMETWHGITTSNGFKNAIELSTVHQEQFDLIIYDATNGPWCLLQLANLYPKAPIVGISAFKVTPDLYNVIDSAQINSATVPFFTTDFNEDMSLWQRFQNMLLYATAYYFRQYFAYPVAKNILLHNEHVHESDILLHINEDLKQRVKVMLVNTHATLDYMQPLLPNVIEVAGLHIGTPSPLSTKMQQKIQQHEAGIILISLHSANTGRNLNDEKLQVIFDVIEHWPEHIFFMKLNDPKKIKDKPKNLYWSNFTDNDILAHPNAKLLITNGATLSLQGAIYYGLPVITMPNGIEQLNNAQRITERHIGLNLNLATLNSNMLFNAINTIFTDPKYTNNGKRLKYAYHARPQTPLETAIWYIEQLSTKPNSLDYLTPSTTERHGYFVTQSWDVMTIIFLFLLAFALNIYFVINEGIKSFKKDKKEKKSNLKELAKVKGVKKNKVKKQ